MRRKHLWALVSIAAMLVAIIWAYVSNVAQGQRLATGAHVKVMLQELEWIDYVAVFYDDLKKEGLLDGTGLASKVQSKLDRTFKEKKVAIGTEKDSILNETGNDKYKWLFTRDKLLSKNIEEWVKNGQLNMFQKLDVTTSFFSEKYADKDLFGFVAADDHFSDFYKLRDHLRQVQNDLSARQLSIYELIRIYLPIIISMLSIVSWIYGVMEPKKG